MQDVSPNHVYWTCVQKRGLSNAHERSPGGLFGEDDPSSGSRVVMFAEVK